MAESGGTSTDVQVIVKILNTHIFINNNTQFLYLTSKSSIKTIFKLPLPFQGQNWVPDSTRALSVQIMSTFKTCNHKITPIYT